MSNSTKGAQSQIKRFERNSRLRIFEPLPITRVQRTEPVNFRQLATHIHDVRVPQGRVANFTAKRLRIATPRVSLSFLFREPAPRRLPHSITFFPFLFFPSPSGDPHSRSFFYPIFFPSASLRGTASPVSEPVRTTLFLFPVITRNQRKSTEPTDKRRHESVTTRTRRYDTAATIENLRGGVSRERVGARSPSRRRRQVDQCRDKSAQMIRHELRYARPAVLPSTGAP